MLVTLPFAAPQVDGCVDSESVGGTDVAMFPDDVAVQPLAEVTVTL
jgi:hypothetical protein